jgi:hypothetical protein
MGWLVNAPGAHPLWQWWVVALIHLRPIEGVRPAHKRYPEAEHEFIIFSIDPESCPEPDPEKAAEGYPHLVPIDVVEQFHGVGDHDAKRICESAVRAIVGGVLSPDQDYRGAWKKCIEGTVAHYRAGKHAEN